MNRIRTFGTTLALALVLITFASTAMAQRVNIDINSTNLRRVPEIDPSSIGSALALLGFGATMMLDRRRRK